MCRRNTRLLEAEVAVKFMLSALKKGESQLAKAFCDALTLRMRQRRTKAAAISTDNPQGFVADESEWEQTFPQGTQKGDDYIT